MTRSRRVIGIMAKAPLAGQAKTRLIPLLGAQRAALLYHHMLLDSIDLASSALDGDGAVRLICPTIEHKTILERIVPRDVAVIAHEQGDLMAGLDFGLTNLINAGFTQVVLFNGDSPTLSPDYLRSAFDLLVSNMVVLGPTLDGGYYVIGADQARSALFHWAHFDSATVCQQTHQRAIVLGAQVALLPPWYDVDTPEDLAHFVRELAMYQDRAPRTRQFLAQASL